MIKKYTATKEEIEGIKEVIDKILQLWTYDFVSASSPDGREISMSKKTFFEQLERELS
jgi:hypothetical protein